jgi:hypothetical protein
VCEPVSGCHLLQKNFVWLSRLLKIHDSYEESCTVIKYLPASYQGDTKLSGISGRQRRRPIAGDTVLRNLSTKKNRKYSSSHDYGDSEVKFSQLMSGALVKF